jgi:hypothetical protein
MHILPIVKWHRQYGATATAKWLVVYTVSATINGLAGVAAIALVAVAADAALGTKLAASLDLHRDGLDVLAAVFGCVNATVAMLDVADWQDMTPGKFRR